MKKIGLFLDYEPLGGGTFQYNQTMVEAVSNLPATQFEVIVGYTSKLWKSYLMEYPSLQTIYVEKSFWSRAIGKIWKELNLPMGWWRKINPLFHPVSKTIVKQDCDLWIFPSQDQWAYQVDVPALGTIHDLMHRYEKFPEISDKGEYKRREYHYSHMCRFARGVLVDSEIGKKQVMESYAVQPNQVFILPFVPPKCIYNTNYDKSLEGKYDLPSKYIFYPAQFWEHKNHKNLIKAIKILSDKLPDIHLVLVGSKKNGYDSVVDLVKSLELENRIHFLGYVPEQDILYIYKKARAMIMPTFCGPTNIPPLEGFAAGCPVAVSNVYGMPEQVGDAALLFDPHSEQDIANIIYQLWNNDELCKKLIEKGYLKNQQWGQEHFNRQLQNILSEILKREKSEKIGDFYGT